MPTHEAPLLGDERLFFPYTHDPDEFRAWVLFALTEIDPICWQQAMALAQDVEVTLRLLLAAQDQPRGDSIHVQVAVAGSEVRATLQSRGKSPVILRRSREAVA